jgi:hypothetical protein
MQVPNPLVPTPVGGGSPAPAPVANAPNVPDSTKHETSRPVTASKDGDRARSESQPPRGGQRRGETRGSQIDIVV